MLYSFNDVLKDTLSYTVSSMLLIRWSLAVNQHGSDPCTTKRTWDTKGHDAIGTKLYERGTKISGILTRNNAPILFSTKLTCFLLPSVCGYLPIQGPASTVTLPHRTVCLTH